MEAEKGDCIIFFTPLIHRGGPSSMANADSIPEDTLTDLVFAFHCYHFGLPSGSETGRETEGKARIHDEDSGEENDIQKCKWFRW
eukprot:scaffold15822_cov39-Cyclotella_meneghiniana.AAC.1